MNEYASSAKPLHNSYTVSASVLMPMKNAGPYVAEAIASILSQSHANLELVVVDDGSTDNSRKVVEGFMDSRIRLLNGRCAGISAAFNLALKRAEGDIVFRCDADDWYPPDRLSEQIDWLCRHPQFKAICGEFSSVDRKGTQICRYAGGKEGEITYELLNGIVRTTYCTFAVERSVLEKIGGCRQYFETAEDIDLQYRIAEACRVFYQVENRYYYRLHDDSTIHQQAHVRREFFDSQAEKFLKQRLEVGKDDVDQGVAELPPDNRGPRNRSNDQIQGHLIGKAWYLHREGKKMEALKVGLEACFTKPAALYAWKNLLILFIK